MPHSPLRVLIQGAFKPDYSRNHVIRAGLERVGVEVIVDNFGSGLPALRRMQKLIARFPRRREVDVVLAPMSNQPAGPLYWMLGRLFRQPVLLDYFLGLTDTNEDRGDASGPRAALYRWIDRFNITRTRTITDTAAHRDAYRALVGVSPAHMDVIPVGINDALFQQLPLTPGEGIKVQFVGTFIPFQGVDVILRAASLLRGERSIRFEIIGQGQTYPAARALAMELALDNVDFLPFVPYDQLAAAMRGSTIQLGVFGDGFKTRYVVPNKVYEGLALGLPMITAESPALNEFFAPGEHILTVPAGDPQRLADAIRGLAKSGGERARIGGAAAKRVHEAFRPEHIGARLKAVLEDLVSRGMR